MDLLLLDNKLEQARRNGSSVVYGQIVQLWHPYSECYVRVSSTVTSPVEPRLKASLMLHHISHVILYCVNSCHIP